MSFLFEFSISVYINHLPGPIYLITWPDCVIHSFNIDHDQSELDIVLERRLKSS